MHGGLLLAMKEILYLTDVACSVVPKRAQGQPIIFIVPKKVLVI